MTQVYIVMGSDSDWSVMKEAVVLLKDFGVNCQAKVVSAHRTPEDLAPFATTCEQSHVTCIIAGAAGAAHLPGMLASFTYLPVIGVPIKGKSLDGMDSLLSIVQMPKGVPVATVGINNSVNAALLAVKILATQDRALQKRLIEYKDKQKQESREKTKNLK